MRRRTGYTLIEVLAVLSVISMIMGITGTLATLLMASSKSQTAQAERNLTMTRLFLEFRRDVHRAKSFEIRSEGKTVLLKGAYDELVEYEFSEGTLSRKATMGEKTDRERFRLNATSVKFQLTAETGQRVLEMTCRLPQLISGRAIQKKDAMGHDVFDVVARLSAENPADPVSSLSKEMP